MSTAMIIPMAGLPFSMILGLCDWKRSEEIERNNFKPTDHRNMSWGLNHSQ